MRLIIIAFASCALSYGATAQEQCTVLLQDGVRNQLSQKYDRFFLDEFHSALCSEDDNRIDRAKGLGLELGYADFVLDFTGSSRKTAAYQSSMCSANDKIRREDEFFDITRNHVSTELADAYVRCVQIQSGGIVYDVRNGSDGDSINFEIGYDPNIRTGGRALNIRKVVVSPERFADKVACEGSLSDKIEDGPYDIRTSDGFETLTCRPMGSELSGQDNDFSVFVHTSLGIIEGFVNPYHTGKDDRIDALKEQVDGRIDALSVSLSRVEDSLRTSPSEDSQTYTAHSAARGGGQNAMSMNVSCPVGQVMVGIDVTVAGTCSGYCEPDGGTIHRLRAICRPRFATE